MRHQRTTSVCGGRSALTMDVGGLMDIGRMRERVEWQSVSTVPSSDGNRQPTASVVSNGTFWAAVKATTGDEKTVNKNQELRSEKTYTVRMRYVGSVLPKDRLIYSGKT